MSFPWPTLRLGELAIKVGSGATPKGGEAAYQTTGTPLVRSMNVVFFGFKEQGLAYINAEQAAALDGATVAADDVLLNITGASIGRVTVAPASLAGARVNQHVCIVRPKAALNARFLNAFLSSPGMQAQIWADNYGVTRQALTKQQILDFEIPLPPLAEQQRIADKLDTVLARVHACRDRLARVASMLKRFRQSVLYAATAGKLTPEFDNSAWQSVRLEDVSTITSGVGFPLSLQGRESGDYPFAKVSDISRAVLEQGGLLGTASNWVSADDLKELRVQAIPSGSTVFAKIGEGLKLNRRALTQIELIIDNNCMAVSPDVASLRGSYLYRFLQTVDLGPLSIATAVPSVRRGDIAALKFPLPPLDEQSEIVRRVETLFAFADRLEARLAQAQTAIDRLTPSLLAKAFRGELVPQDPADEPAAELLKRLAAQRAAAPAAPRRRRAASMP